MFDYQPNYWEEYLNKAKSFDIPKQLVWDAYQHVYKNHGAAGIDGISIKMFHAEHKEQLYKLWNRMSSGSYFPPPVKTVLIPKKSGGVRPLGIPTVSDRVAQAVVKQVLEPSIEPHFDENSYGFRPGKSALDAVAQTRQRCWKYQWVIDLDIRGFFDNIDHGLILRAVEKHTTCRWALLYIKRWLSADIQQPDGSIVKREKGTPQGGVISPLLANLFLHYAFDRWMRKHFPGVPFERYADDIIVHCQMKHEANKMLQAIKDRLEECKLEVNVQKTRIVYCGNNRIEPTVERSFDFLGYTFRPRLAQSKYGRFVTMLPAISNTAKKHIRQTIKGWKIHHQLHDTMESLAKWINPCLRGWINYYGKFYRSEVSKPLLQVEHYLIRWIQRKYKKKTGSLGIKQALRYLGQVRKHQPRLFEHWRYGWVWVTDGITRAV